MQKPYIMHKILHRKILKIDYVQNKNNKCYLSNRSTKC